MTEVIISLFKPQAGREDDLKTLLTRLTLILRQMELVTNRPRLTMISEDGTYLEVIEWMDEYASEQAQNNADVVDIWKKLKEFCEVRKLSQLAETKEDFCHFTVVREMSEMEF